MSLYVWGTGCGAGELIERGFEPARITAFVESVPESRSFLGRKVIAPEEIDASDCELIIVSTRYTKEVMELCRSLGIAVEKLFFLKNSCTLIDLNEKSVAPQVLGDELYSRLKPRHRLIKEPESLTGKTADSGDYIRLAQLELICGRLCHVPGAAAELGVFRGDFARHINRLLPERKLYLFDSFQGFEEKSGAGEAFQAAHENTSIAAVIKKLPHPDKVEICPGFFPASLKGLEERFCLVSLDVDFYDATLEGLRYFWPRLNEGGYLLLHDWGSVRLDGVAKALETYEKEQGKPLPAVPLCDIGASLILVKN